MKGIFNPIQRAQQVFFLGLVFFTVGRAIEEGRSDQSGQQDNYVIPSITIHGNKRIICRDGWIPARTSNSGTSITFVCIKLYRNPSSWLDSRDACRAHNSFLVKLENRIGIKHNFLDQILRNEGIDHVWSGLHVDESKLVWDELQPNVIDSFIGQTELYGNVKRGWKWHPGTFDNTKNTCGAFAAGKHDPHKRAVRSASPEDDNYYPYNYPNTIRPESAPEMPPDYTGYTESLPTSTVDLHDAHDDDLDSNKGDHPEPSADDNSGTKHTTPNPENNKNDTSSKEVTESNSKELTTTAAPNDINYTTTEFDSIEYTTVPNIVLPGIVKRSTMVDELIATTSPTVQTTEGTQSDSVEDNSTATFTPAPSPTASAPAKGTSSSTAATFEQTEKDNSSKEIVEEVASTATTSTKATETTTMTTTQATSTMAATTATTTENQSNEEKTESHLVSASTLPEEESVVSKSRTAKPKIVQPNNVEIPSISNLISNQDSLVQDIKPMIELENCQQAYPFICYSEPIEDLSPDHHCGNQWVSHENLDKCYKVIERPLTHKMAAKNCYDQGGRLADVFITFYGNVTALAFQKHPRRQDLGTHAWVGHAETRMDPQNSKCDAILGYSIAKVNCSTKLPSICEKQVPQTDLGQTENFGDFLDSPDKIKVLYMTTTRPGTILCPLQSSSPDDLILWYKDGVLIQDLGSVYLGMNSNTFKMNHQNRFSNTLKLDMTIFRRMKTNSRHRHVASMLQGKYWCEVWRRRPFQRIKSMKFLIRYRDVITLFGTIQTTGVRARQASYFNLMDTPIGLPKRIAEDLDFINNNISRIATNFRLPLNNVVSELIRVDNETGRVEFFTYLQLSHEVPETYKSQIVSVYLDNMNKMVVDNTAAVSRRWNLLSEVTKYIFISRTDICPAKYLEDDLTGLGAHFPTTSINTTSMSNEKCDGKAAGSARCIGNLEEGAYWNDWVIDNECESFPDKPSSEEFVETFDGRNGDEVELLYPSVFAQQTPPNPGLVQLEEIAIEDGNVDDVSDKMVEILSHSQSLTDEDITTIAKVMDKIDNVATPSIQVSKNLMTTVDKVLDVNDKVLNLAETQNHAASRILTNLENLAKKAKLGRDKNVRLVTANVAMEVWDLDKDDAPVIGLGAIVAKSWSMPLTEPRIMTIRDRADGQLEDFDVAIEIPEQLVKNRMKNGNSTRLTMFIYRKIGLFKSNSTTMVVNSPIISATVGGEKVENLSEKVRIVFRPFKSIDDREAKTKCVYWDFEENDNEGGWSTRGCRYEGTLYDKDVCMCDHLTNFAVLLDFYGNHQPIDPVHDFSLSILSMIGLSLSIFGLGMTIVTFLFFKKLRKGRAQQTLFHMALSLLGSELVFLVGIKQTDNYYVCLSVAVLLHYFILVSFMWMLVEAILQYLTFVKVLGTYISRYTLKTAIPAWGIPLIPVITVLNIDYTLYKGRASYCWMDLSAFYYAFALPIGLIILFNVVMFIIIIISLGRRPRGLRAHQSKSKNNVAKTNLKAALTIFVLLGLTWSFGYMAIADARLVFQYIFTFLSSLQGFFIFILLVARRKQIRDQWMMICCKEGGIYRKRKSVSATNSNSNSTASNGSSSSGTSRRNLHNASTRTIDTIIHNKSFDSLYFIPTSSIPTKNTSPKQ